MKLSMAYSECPNDTFMFHDVAAGRLREEDLEIDVHLHDVETLNRLALAGTYDITKVSFHAYLLVRREYELLSTGAALGFGCGPVVVSRRALAETEVPFCTIALPGELTTAHLLLRLWTPHAANKVFVRYDEVIPMVAAGQADCGVIIHEERFLYESAGLRCVADLGQWWEETTRLPIPLGGIVVRKSLGGQTRRRIETLLRGAIEHSRRDPRATMEYVRAHARAADPAVIQKHIETFVNRFSLELGEEGRRAVAEMERLSRAAGVIA